MRTFGHPLLCELHERQILWCTLVWRKRLELSTCHFWRKDNLACGENNSGMWYTLSCQITLQFVHRDLRQRGHYVPEKFDVGPRGEEKTLFPSGSVFKSPKKQLSKNGLKASPMLI
jgi:hypothetical protein